MAKKIGIMGTHGTGKTTLAMRMASDEKTAYPHLTVTLLPEVARAAPGVLNEEATLKTQKWIHYTQYTREIENEKGSDVLVCDRTILDSLCYSYVLGYERFVRDSMKNAINWLKTEYTELYLRTGDKPYDDGVRSADTRFAKNVQDTFLLFLNWHDIKYTLI